MDLEDENARLKAQVAAALGHAAQAPVQAAQAPVQAAQAPVQTAQAVQPAQAAQAPVQPAQVAVQAAQAPMAQMPPTAFNWSAAPAAPVAYAGTFAPPMVPLPTQAPPAAFAIPPAQAQAPPQNAQIPQVPPPQALQAAETQQISAAPQEDKEGVPEITNLLKAFSKSLPKL